MGDLDRAFGQAVRQRRGELGISQEELGFLAGVHRTYISQIERGKKSPSLKVIGVLARALSIEASALVQQAEYIRLTSAQVGDNQ